MSSTAAAKPTPSAYGKAGPGADLRMFMEKRLVVTLNSHRKVAGYLRGYDLFMNLVLERAVEILPKSKLQRELGTIVIRGNTVVMYECIDKLRRPDNS